MISAKRCAGYRPRHRHEFSGSWQPFGVFRGICGCVRLGCSRFADELYRVDSNGKLGSGDLYALPNSYSVTGIYFNTKLAEQLGIDAAPTSVEEFEADMQTAKDAGILPMMTYAKDGGTSFVFQALMANNSSAEDVQNWILQKSGTFDNQAAQDAASTLQDWNNKGYMPEGVNAVDASTALSRFCNGEGLFFPER